jgi:hypothetical protein
MQAKGKGLFTGTTICCMGTDVCTKGVSNRILKHATGVANEPGNSSHSKKEGNLTIVR